MKKLLLCTCLSFLSPLLLAQKTKDDPRALLLLDRMSEVIGDLTSCKFKLSTSFDTKVYQQGFVKQFGTHQVYLVGPNKMLIDSYGHKGHCEYFYNGKQLAFYSHEENNFAIMKAPSTIMKTIDSVSANFDIDFPAADFFYPTFTDDLIQASDSILYLGKVDIDGKEYFHILANGKELNIQIWINSDAYNLPAKFLIIYNSEEGHPQYQASFSDWELNPNLPTAMFEFLPPAGANKVRMMAKTEK